MSPKKARWLLGIVPLVLCAVVLSVLELAARWQPPLDISRYEQRSQEILAADGSVLKAHLSPDGFVRLHTRSGDLTSAHLAMLLATEDARFYDHGGIDTRAIARATWSALSTGRIRSGASTITMQLARLLTSREGGISGKLRQMFIARRLELEFAKHQLLDMYLTLAPFGGNLEGVRAASLSYFRREPRELTAAEAALLVALPQAPEKRRPDRFLDNALSGRDIVVASLKKLGHLSALDMEASPNRAPTPRSRPFSLADHLADRFRAHESAAPIRSLLERRLQHEVEEIADRFISRDDSRTNIAILIVRNHDMAVVASLGGARYGDPERAGYVDLTRSVRSPGSTLKPFIYGFAFDDLVLHPDTIVTDVPQAFGSYQPENFGAGFEGDMTVRQALLRSVNTTAIYALDWIGVSNFLTRIRRAGATYQVPGELDGASLPIGLGGGGISLADLALLYVAIATDGNARPLRYVQDDPLSEPIKLLDGDSAWAIRDILADMPDPEGLMRRHARDGNRRIAYKTGTSYGFRDAWAIGFDAAYTVGVWIGRPDSAPNVGATGARAAAPVLYRLFDVLPNPSRGVVGPTPRNSVLATSENLPARIRRVAPRNSPESTAAFRISFPRDGVKLRDCSSATGKRSLVLSVSGGLPPFRWIVNGRLLPNATQARQFTWEALEAGEVSLAVMDASERTAHSSFWIESQCP